MNYKRLPKKYNLGGAIGTAAGTALSLIPGIGPIASAVATPLLSAAGSAIQKRIEGEPEPESQTPVVMTANPNNYSSVRTFKYGGKPKLKTISGPKHEQGGVPLKDKNGKVIGEVEGGETKLVKDGNPEFIFSDSVMTPDGESFADASKRLKDSPEDLKKLANLQEVMKGSTPVYKRGGKPMYVDGGKILDIASIVAPIASAAIGTQAYKTPELKTNKGYGRARALMPTKFSMDAARVGVRQSELNTADTLSNMSGSRQGLRSAVVSSRAKSLNAQSDIAMKEQMGQLELDQARANLEIQAGADEQSIDNQNATNTVQARNMRTATVAQGLKGVTEAAVGIRKDRLAEQADDDRIAAILATSRLDIDPELIGSDRYIRLMGQEAYDNYYKKKRGNTESVQPVTSKKLVETVSEKLAPITRTKGSAPYRKQPIVSNYRKGGKVKYC